MNRAQTAVFVLGSVADAIMLPLTLALKSSGDVLQQFWLGLGALSVCGFATRFILLRRRTVLANAWAEALVPTRLGAMIFFGVIALVVVLLPLVALFG